MGFIAYGYLPFLHGFQQCTLYFGGGTVYFICQNKIGKNGAFSYHKLIALLVINHGTHHICRQQVWGKLYAAKPGMYRLCQRFNSECFSKPRHTFQQYMPIAQQANHQPVHHVQLPNYYFRQFGM